MSEFQSVRQDDGQFLVSKSIMAVPEGWGLTWADDQIWSGMYGISLNVGKMAFRFKREGKKDAQSGCSYNGGETFMLQQIKNRINCHSHLTIAMVGHYSTVSLLGGYTATFSTPQPIHTTTFTPICQHYIHYAETFLGLVNVTHQSDTRQTRTEWMIRNEKSSEGRIEDGGVLRRGRGRGVWMCATVTLPPHLVGDICLSMLVGVKYSSSGNSRPIVVVVNESMPFLVHPRTCLSKSCGGDQCIRYASL